MKMKSWFRAEGEAPENLSNTRSLTSSLSALYHNHKRSQSSCNTRVKGLSSRSTLDSATIGDLHSVAPDEKRVGKIVSDNIRGFIKKASESFKNRRHLQEREDRSDQAWGRIRSASGLNRRPRSQSGVSRVYFQGEIRHFNTPVPGNRTQPPKIPHGHGGSAARAAAAAENKVVPFTSIPRDYTLKTRQLFQTGGQQEDRESGIGISVTAIPLSRTGYSDSSNTCSEISRVDFVSGLPSELAIQILIHLDQMTLRRIASVSKQWLKISQTQCIWREVFLREQTKTYATGKPIHLGAGLGLPMSDANTNWKDLYRVREQLKQNWMRGTAEAVYLSGHLDSIYCVQFDEKKMITGSRDKTIRVWDLKKYICTLIIGPPDIVNVTSIMIGDNGGRIPDTASFPIHHNKSILCLQYDEEMLATGSSDGTCILHDIKNSYKPIRQLRHHTAAVLDLAFDNHHIVTCSKDITICVWNRETGVLIKQLRGHSGPVNAVQLRGNTIVSCSGDFRVKLWNIDTGKNIKELVGHTKGLACSQFSEDSRFIASAGNDKSIRIWDANSGEALKNIMAHENLVRSLHIDSISGRLISGSYDQDIKVFDMATGAMLLDFPKWHSSWVLGAKSDYRRIISTGQDPKILIMDFGMNIKGIEKLES